MEPSKLRGEWLWEMIRAHVVPSALGEVPHMMRGTVRAQVDKKFSALSPAVKNALERCAGNLAAAVICEFQANVQRVREAKEKFIRDNPDSPEAREEFVRTLNANLGIGGAASVDHQTRPTAPTAAARPWRPEDNRG